MSADAKGALRRPLQRLHRRLERRLEAVEQVVDLAIVDDERRADADGVARQGPDDEAVLLGVRRDGGGRLGGRRVLRPGALVLDDLNGADEADAARLADEVLVGQPLQPLLEVGHHAAHVAQRVVLRRRS